MWTIRYSVAAASALSLSIGFGAGLLASASRPLEDPSMEFELVFNPSEASSSIATTYSLEWKGHFSLMISDRDHDGVIDGWYYEVGDEDVFQLEDWNNDHVLDSWWKATGGVHGVVAIDEDFDGVVDTVEPTVMLHTHCSEETGE